MKRGTQGLKQIKAGPLEVGYIEMRPPYGIAVILQYGWPTTRHAWRLAAYDGKPLLVRVAVLLLPLLWPAYNVIVASEQPPPEGQFSTDTPVTNIYSCARFHR